MNIFFRILHAGCLLALMALPTVADDTLIKQAISGYQDAFNQQDVAKLTESWASTATYHDESTGADLRGRDAILKQLQGVFSESPTPTLKIFIASIGKQPDGSVLVVGTNTLSKPGHIDEEFSFTAHLQKHDDRWQIDSVRETAVIDAVARPASLSQIEWLIGTWETTDDSRLVNRFAFMPGENFIIRTFGKTENDKLTSAGHQIIGVVPGGTQLQSWTFLADGSMGRADWTVEEDRVSIASTQLSPDGSTASGTYVLKPVDDNTLSIKVVGHSIDGEPVASGTTATLHRQTTEQASEDKK